MTEINDHTPGSFCWTELGTLGAGEAKKFYSNLFGWESKEFPMGPDSFYTMFQVKERDVCGLYELKAEQKAMNVPPNWLNYVCVENTDLFFEKAKELKANVVMPPMDVPEAGRMAVLTDPTGAFFALWQPKSKTANAWAQGPGGISWNELRTNNVDIAGSFYSKLFGWTIQSDKMENFTYYSFSLNGKPVAGMMEIQKEWGSVPPHWQVYFGSNDVDADVKKVVSLGGKKLTEPMNFPGGRFAELQDPQGAHFAIIHFNQK